MSKYKSLCERERDGIIITTIQKAYYIVPILTGQYKHTHLLEGI